MYMNDLHQTMREEVCSGVNAGVCDFVNGLTRPGADAVNGMTKLVVRWLRVAGSQ
jgi:hypothetical protein